MPAYVLVEFDNNETAKRFVTKVNGDYKAVTEEEVPNRRVRAVWSKPTKFCPPNCKGEADKGVRPFRHDKKTGWWVHVTCGRPTMMWAKGNHWFSAIGRNRLPGNSDFTPLGWGVLDPVFGEQTGAIIPVGDPDSDEMPTGRAEQKAARRRARRAKAEHPRRPTPPGDLAGSRAQAGWHRA